MNTADIESLHMTDAAAYASHAQLRAVLKELRFNTTTSCTDDALPPNNRTKCLPHFYVLGVPKAGTTELFTLLCSHPSIDCRRRGGVKEMSLWNMYVDLVPSTAHPVSTARLRSFVRDSLLIFKPDNGSIFGDATPEYLGGYALDGNFDRHRYLNWKSPKDPTAPLPQLVHILQPSVRLLAVLRDPVERAWSQFKFFVGDVYSRNHGGRQSSNLNARFFEETVDEELAAFTNCSRLHGLRCAFGSRHGFASSNGLAARSGLIGLTTGFYAFHLRVWRAYHGAALKAVCFEELARQPQATMQAVWDHLDVDRLRGRQELDALLRSRRRGGSNPTVLAQALTMSAHARQQLVDFYRPHTQQLARDALLHGPRVLPLCTWAANATDGMGTA